MESLPDFIESTDTSRNGTGIYHGRRGITFVLVMGRRGQAVLRRDTVSSAHDTVLRAMGIRSSGSGMDIGTARYGSSLLVLFGLGSLDLETEPAGGATRSAPFLALVGNRCHFAFWAEAALELHLFECRAGRLLRLGDRRQGILNRCRTGIYEEYSTVFVIQGDP